ncbi:MAG: hypothetical protein HC893_15340 [Chloroflexaceae bacterium]|nr:hypothetical protein [Chloroflexaceae bacterium]
MRVWSRRQNVFEYSRDFSPFFGLTIRLKEARFRFLTTEQGTFRSESFGTYQTEPFDSNGQPNFLALASYDLLNYIGFQTGVLSAFANNLTVGTIATTGRRNDTTKIINLLNTDPSAIDLADAIAFDQADIATQNQVNGSGLQAAFYYEVFGNEIGLPVQAEAQITYQLTIINDILEPNPPIFEDITTNPTITEFAVVPYPTYLPAVERGR